MIKKKTRMLSHHFHPTLLLASVVRNKKHPDWKAGSKIIFIPRQLECLVGNLTKFTKSC